MALIFAISALLVQGCLPTGYGRYNNTQRPPKPPKPPLPTLAPQEIEACWAAAKAGDPMGQICVGELYLSGAGGEKDVALAVQHIKKAADQGHPRGMSTLGFLHLHGMGLSKDPSAAFQLFSAAAARKDPRGMAGLGMVQPDGLGVPKDRDLALRLFRESAELGSPEGQACMGFLRHQGDDGEPDIVGAYKWYEIATITSKNGGTFPRLLFGTLDGLSYRDLTEGQLAAWRWREERDLNPAMLGWVQGVPEGGLLAVRHGGRQHMIRLRGIGVSTPGALARQRVRELAINTPVVVELHGLDATGHQLADVFLVGGYHLNRLLVREGLAWFDPKWSGSDVLRAFQEEAKQTGRGLWKNPTYSVPKYN